MPAILEFLQLWTIGGLGVIRDGGMDHERRHVFFSGRVQGVGFRYSTQRIAKGFAVTGFVQNLPDGRVELVAEGNSAELQAFLQEVGERLANSIRSTAVDRRPATGEFHAFRIRH
ncbi:acylphosphatase [Bythopirellula polymerisocia]|nr:acylphosphatase [Bythopirellula polymerisocia]